MDIQRKRQSKKPFPETPEKKHEERNALSDVAQIWGKENNIERPHAHTRRNVFVMGGIIIVVAFIIVVSNTSERAEKDTPATNNEAQNSERAITAPIVQQTGALTQFDSSRFYGVRIDNSLSYFGRITEYTKDHYRLESVFYPEQNQLIEEDTLRQAQGDTGNKITLVKFGTEEYRPDDVLFIPREHVVEIFLLSEDSPIAQAMKEYLESEE